MSAIEQLSLSFSVPGVPVPGGSKKAWPIHAKGCPAGRRQNRGPCVCKPRIALQDVTGERGKAWRAQIALGGAKAMQKAGITELLRGAIYLEMTFFMPRPKSHYGTGKNQCILRNNAPLHHTVTPDRTKLLRAAEDALTNVIWADDSQVVDGPIRKVYAQKTPGVSITVSLL